MVTGISSFHLPPRFIPLISFLCKQRKHSSLRFPFLLSLAWVPAKCIFTFLSKTYPQMSPISDQVSLSCISTLRPKLIWRCGLSLPSQWSSSLAICTITVMHNVRRPSESAPFIAGWLLSDLCLAKLVGMGMVRERWHHRFGCECGFGLSLGVVLAIAEDCNCSITEVIWWTRDSPICCSLLSLTTSAVCAEGSTTQSLARWV